MKKKIIDNIILTLCLLSVNGAMIYFFFNLKTKAILAVLFLSAVELIFINLFFVPDQNALSKTNNNFSATNKNHFNWWQRLSLIFYFFLYLSLIYLLLINRTGLSLVSPWQVVPNYFFIIFFLATFILLYLTINWPPKKPNLLLILAIAHYLLVLTVAVIVYQIGYGFDPFVHQAAVKLIVQKGFIEPKTPYYLGQYSLEVLGHKLLRLPISWLDKLLVPLLAAVFLPFEINSVWQKLTDKKLTFFLTILFLILPFSFLIITTPQNLAYLFLVLAILRSLRIKSKFDLIVITAFCLTALSAQPIAGIPALIFALWLWINELNLKKTIKACLEGILILTTALSLPLAFSILNKSFSWSEFILGLHLPYFKFSWPNHFYLFLNPVYLWYKNGYLIYFLTVLAGLWLAIKKRMIADQKIKIYLSLCLALIISYILSAALPFDFLIDYERLNYANRLLFVTALFGLPFVLVVLAKFGLAWQKQNKIIRFAWLIFMASLITANFYLSYPRQDPYFNSRSYSTSIYDLQAVNWIENNALNDNYIVLANQQVSAAALYQFGFKKYYSPAYFSPKQKSKENKKSPLSVQSKIFYYPIPTASPLYAYYLDMIYKKPSRQTMKKACQLVGVKKGYFVVNKYWWAFDKVIKEAKLESDQWHKFGPDLGEVYVFVYYFET